MFRLKAIIGTLVVVGIGSAALAACGTPTPVVAGVGSDTTYWVNAGSHNVQGTVPPNARNGISTNYNASQTAVKTYEVPPVLTAPFPGPTFTVPADSQCTTATTYNGSNPPPNGSSAGISALVNDTNGCVDFARSSRGSKVSDPSSLSFWAYALDAVSWIKFPENTHGVSSLTPAQLKNIYTCDPATGVPFASNWNQVGGTTGTIVKYAPQTLSGTYAFVNSKLLGGATIDQNCNAAHLSTFLEEHDATGIPAAQKANAIYFFSVAQYNAQKGGYLIDLRNGSALGNINGVAPTAATINETAGRFFGTRYVYNVTKSTSPQLSATLDFIGVKAGGPGYVCNNTASATISIFGEVPLPLGGTGAGLPNSYCRLNPTPL